jgi:thiamine pyrophosphokinase
MHVDTIINSNRSIIVLNGEQPDKRLLTLINTKVPIIAADGAAHRLSGYGLTPTFIVGDGDSYTNPEKAPLRQPAWFDTLAARPECAQSACIEGPACFDRAQHKTFDGYLQSKHPGLSLSKAHHERAAENPYPEATVIRIADQNSTDFEKCMDFAERSNFLPCLILGINGGEIDHIVGNIQMLTRHAQGQNFYFLDTYPKISAPGIGLKLGLPLSKQTLTLQLKPECTISFMSFHEAIVQTQGLEWELHKQLLTLDGILSLRNRSKNNMVSFTLKSGKALAVIDITDLVQLVV